MLIAGIFGLSGCVVTERGYDHRGEPYAESRGGHDYDRHDDRDNRWDSDHHGDGCQPLVQVCQLGIGYKHQLRCAVPKVNPSPTT